jgi:hypothetical protein
MSLASGASHMPRSAATRWWPSGPEAVLWVWWSITKVKGRSVPSAGSKRRTTRTMPRKGAKTAASRNLSSRGARPTLAQTVRRVLSERVDLDVAQISSRTLVPPTKVKHVLLMMEKDGIVEIVQPDPAEPPRYKLADH